MIQINYDILGQQIEELMQKEKIRRLAHDLIEHFGANARSEAVERYTLMFAISLDDGARLWQAVAEEVEDLSSAGAPDGERVNVRS